MNTEKIEQVIREFDYCRYGLHDHHDLEDEPEARWPGALAEAIATALEIERPEPTEP